MSSNYQGYYPENVRKLYKLYLESAGPSDPTIEELIRKRRNTRYQLERIYSEKSIIQRKRTFFSKIKSKMIKLKSNSNK